MRWLLIVPVFFLAVLAGCSASLTWVPEPRAVHPSCVPDRLPSWEDFSKRETPTATPAAQTAIQFLLQESPPHLIAKFDHDYSWVKPQPANPKTPVEWIASQKLLAHEQVHFLISCLLVRQANRAIQTEDDPQKMLELVKSVAQRLNVQYDSDTKHGTVEKAQMDWEIQVQQQFEEVTSETSEDFVKLKDHDS